MKVIILGVCGKLMAGIACLAESLGFDVIGYDRDFAPPMSEMLNKKNNINLLFLFFTLTLSQTQILYPKFKNISRTFFILFLIIIQNFFC